MPNDEPEKVTETDFDLEELDEPVAGDDSYLKSSARLAIAAAAFEGAVSPSVRRKIVARKNPTAVVIRVPTPAWIGPIGAYWSKHFGAAWKQVLRDGSDNRRHSADKGSDEVALELTERSVVGIAADARILPATLVAAADFRINIALPSGELMAEAVARYHGKPHDCDFSKISVLGLDFPDILASFRANSSPREIRRRLAAISAKTSLDNVSQSLPDLKTAVEYGEARRWALNLAQDIEDFRAGRIPWSAIDRGAVVYSKDPGLGKSLWARMVAASCGIKIVESNVADWASSGSGYLSDVIRAERQVFAAARALALQSQAPCLLFLDEIDAIPNRDKMSDRNRDFWTVVLGDVLSNLDNGLAVDGDGWDEGENKRGRIIVIGATNRIADLDPALMRPGRLERAIEIKRPNYDGTLNILRYHVAGDIPDGDLGEIAVLIENATGAEIMQCVREARRLARRRKGTLSSADLRAAALPRSDLDPETLWRICIHEAGHAIGTLASKSGAVKRCVVRENGGGLGETLIENVDLVLPTKDDIENRAVAVLCGRAAEEAVFTKASSNAGGDLKSDLAIATRLVSSLYTSVGLGGSLAYLADSNEVVELLRNDRLLRLKVEKHLAVLHRRARNLMRRHREAVTAVAESASSSERTTPASAS
ncbi:AAA family ATPase [Bradyrhizobium sp. 1(2017)]|uniref:AAA family ATPase n=1 Tax=Bradyrhizobium sp. 1(2017) TaxID=1404888 RepID=UPI00140F2F85|nr:AAA family ATPase [Bradyrhizobium sp. 1(2017)]QIO36949.1 AAA family ATPase [Bradyrhizobium sp. 1(2017)]